MWDYEFQLKFASWFHHKKKAVRTACLVGIRTQESFSRWQTIYGGNKKQLYHQYQWSFKIACDVFNLYPIYDSENNRYMDSKRKIQMAVQ